MEFDCQLEILCRGSINQNCKIENLHTVHDPVDPPILEVEVLKHPSEEPPAHPVIGPLYTQLDCHKASFGRGTL